MSYHKYSGSGGTGISSATQTALNLKANLTSAVLVTPNLGTPSAGVLTNCTGTAPGLTAGNVTTNANLTGVITSVGNATSIASQTGTGTKFVMDNGPTLVSPILGTPASGNLANCTGYPAVASSVVAWAYVNSSSGSIVTNGSLNLTVTRNSAGDYTCTFGVARANANYAVFVTTNGADNLWGRVGINTQTGGTEVAPTTAAFRFVTVNNAINAYTDNKYVYIQVLH